MKDFSDAVFAPEAIELMTAALEASVATLPEPVSSTQVTLLAESILRTAKAGEPWRDRLLRLPRFLRKGEGAESGFSDQDLRDGFQLTGLFLLRHVLEPRGQHHSDAREGFIGAVTRQRARKALTSS